MIEQLPILIPILLADVINPVLLAADIYALGGRKPIFYSLMVLTGWLVVYFGSGVLIAMGLESIMSFLNNPRPIDFYIELVIAALLIWFGIKFILPSKTSKKEEKYDDSSKLNAIGAFGIGATINLIGLPFALPYFAALDQILKANMGWVESLSTLLLYNLLYVAPFAILIFIKVLFGEKGERLLQTVNNWMDKIGKVLLPGMMILLAIALIIDAVKYFTTGTPWF
jgi:cytochrome c biogenesis protein CcdA